VKAHDQKPKWALTQQEAEHSEEAEVDDLLSFAAELDYESFINDFEIR
jgi:hypothetical protein